MKDKLMSTELELGMVDALFRINRELERFGKGIYLSFSGGKDSTVLAELIKMCGNENKIPFVFANTGIELDATLKFIKEYPYENVMIVKPRKPAVKVWKEYGVPIKSKLKSEALNTYQNNIEDPLGTSRTRQLISGKREKGGVRSEEGTSYALAKKDFHLLHPDLGYKIANKCCQYMKKYPFQDFAKENDMSAAFSGVRTDEGGVRSMQYKSCVHVKKLNGKDFVMSMPIIDWSDGMVEEFIKIFGVKVSDAYTEYGLQRTGCIACPFSQQLDFDLKTLWEREPLKYKATMKMLKNVYIDSGIKCDWDEDYMKDYHSRWVENEKRRYEMQEKFSDQLAHRVKIGSQISLF